MDLETFHTIVTRMTSANNAERSEAEKTYDALEITTKASLLLQLYAIPTAAAEARAMCLVLLRRLFSSCWEELWPTLGADNQKTITTQLLKSATEETDPGLRKKLADVVSEIARNTINDDTGKQDWTDVLQFLEHCINSDSAELKMTAMALIESVPNIFGADQGKYLAGIKQVLETCLTHQSANVRSAAVKAYVAFVVENEEDDKLVKTLAGSIPAVINVCKHVVDTEEDDDSPLQCLADLASTVPKLITPHLNAVLDLCTQTIANPDKDNSYRHSAMEVITSFCETAPNTIKKRAANYIPNILQSALFLMTELEDDIEEWLTVDDAEQDDDEDSAGVGESSLDRIACALNGKPLMQPFTTVVQQLLSSDDWKKRHAGLMGISTIGEGCQRSMEPNIAEFVNYIVPFLKDPHPRVRYAACNALGQMSTDFAPTLQKKCHEKVIPGLLESLVETSCPRVSAHAGAALVNFSEDCPKNVITAYLPGIMEKLEFVLHTTFKNLVDSGKKLVLEQVITTIASVADAAQEFFAEYYGRLMGPLKYILQNSDGEQFKTLRGKTIECISLIGLAVGKSVFATDAAEIMNMLSTTMPNLSPDDPQCSYMISSWTRICKVLGRDFAPFLPMVMDPVMRAASYKPDVAVVDDDEVEADPAWSFHSIGDNKNFGIRTSGLEEKATACEMIVCYARELKDAFEPYVDGVAKQMLEHLKFIFHDGVRSSAAETFPCLLECVKHHGVDAMRRLWVEYFPAALAAINTEVDAEVTAEILNSIGECVEQLGSNGLTGEELQQIVALMKEQLEEYEKRRMDREAQEADEDADPEEAKEEMNDEAEMEASLLARISDIVHSCFKTFGENFFPLIEPMLPQFLALIDVRRTYADRQWGVCIIDDMVEFSPRSVSKYQPQFVPILLKSLNDEYAEVRQAAAYGFGIMAMTGGADYLPTVTHALEPLAQMISRADARSTEESSVATDNAIAAVSKILKYAGAQVDVTQAIPAFVSWLPTHEDKEESVHIYGYFCDLVEANHPSILGQDNSGLPRILDIVVSSFHLDAFDNEAEGVAQVQERLKNIAKLLHANGGVFQAILDAAQFSEEKKQTLQKLLA